MGSDAKNLISDGKVQIVHAGDVIGATQLTDGELIVEAGGRAENTVVTDAGWLKVETGGIAKCTQYSNNGTLSVGDGAIATDIVQSDGGAISLSTLATVNGRHPEGEFSVDQAMPAVYCWRMAVICGYWRAIARKKSFWIRMVVCWSTEQHQQLLSMKVVNCWFTLRRSHQW